MPTVMPTLEQVRQLPAVQRLTIPAEWLDLNGHVNVQHYLGIYDLASWTMMQELGIAEGRIDAEQSGLFDLEHHLWYLAEMHVGDVTSTHFRYLGRSAKRFHFVMFIVNETRASLACAMECVTSAADLRTRRTAPLPDDVAQRITDLINQHSRLDWPAPTCGAIAP